MLDLEWWRDVLWLQKVLLWDLQRGGLGSFVASQRHYFSWGRREGQGGRHDEDESFRKYNGSTLIPAIITVPFCLHSGEQHQSIQGCLTSQNSRKTCNWYNVLPQNSVVGEDSARILSEALLSGKDHLITEEHKNHNRWRQTSFQRNNFCQTLPNEVMSVKLGERDSRSNSVSYISICDYSFPAGSML